MSDLINRQDAIDALEEQLDYLQMLNKDENPKAESTWYGVNWARNTIADLPSAERTGKWVRNMDSLIGTIQKPYCSACGQSAIGNHGFDCVITNYCPNCGADMRKEVKE